MNKKIIEYLGRVVFLFMFVHTCQIMIKEHITMNYYWLASSLMLFVWTYLPIWNEKTTEEKT